MTAPDFGYLLHLAAQRKGMVIYMKNFTAEQIEKAKGAKSAEELLALAKEVNLEMTEEEAKAYFAQLNPEAGELSDEELDNVAGGGCETSSGHTIVTSAKKCFTGQWESVRNVYYKGTPAEISVWENTSDLSLRETWWTMSLESGTCGNCKWLEFKAGTGYCSKS